MKKENKIHVLCCTDNNFVMQSSVMMQSVICNHEDGAIVFHVIIDNSVTEESKQLLEEEVAKTSNHIQFHLFESDKIKSYPRIGIKSALRVCTSLKPPTIVCLFLKCCRPIFRGSSILMVISSCVIACNRFGI